VDQTGGRLIVPDNITLLPLPPHAPELNPMENVWEYLRANKLSRLVWDSYDAIVAACRDGWNFLINDPDRIRSIGHRDWTCVNVWAVLVVRRETGKEQEVQVLYDEDIASHIAPEPCVVSREGQGEASAGDHAGWPLSRESRISQTPTGLPTWKATRAVASSRAADRSGVVRDPACVDTPCSGTGRSRFWPGQ
jgi:hypothetical protein